MFLFLICYHLVSPPVLTEPCELLSCIGWSCRIILWMKCMWRWHQKTWGCCNNKLLLAACCGLSTSLWIFKFGSQFVKLLQHLPRALHMLDIHCWTVDSVCVTDSGLSCFYCLLGNSRLSHSLESLGCVPIHSYQRAFCKNVCRTHFNSFGCNAVFCVEVLFGK
jgi:hypothetical protein